MLKKMMITVLAVAALAGCKTTDYATVQPDQYQIAGHPYKSAKDCHRKAPVGKFDQKCDVPYVGIRDWSPGNDFGVSVGGNGSGPSL